MYFRGDPNLMPPDVSERVPINRRDKVEKGWDKEYPYFVELREAEDVEVLAQYLVNISYPLSGRKRDASPSRGTLKDNSLEDEVLWEGAKVTITANRYERNSVARKLCIAKWGTRCAACSIDMSEVYGPRGAGFIHVHHLNPIGKQKGEYRLDPINDLRPVCPNCHAIIHRYDPPLQIDELKALVKSAKSP